MKTSLKIFLLAVALVAMGGCSAQRRAERQVRRAVALCPELVQVKAHLIDTVVTAPAFADCATLPIGQVLSGGTVYAATDHGTFVVSVSDTDSSLRVGFVAAPQKVHFTDTVRYARVVVPEPAKQRSNSPWQGVALGLSGIGVGVVLGLYYLRDIMKNKPEKRKP